MKWRMTSSKEWNEGVSVRRKKDEMEKREKDEI